MIKKLLYLTFISEEDSQNCGSSVRPNKMQEGFNNFDIDLRTFYGINNNFKVRKETNNKINLLLKKWKPNACYIEPPSGPMFYFGDLLLIRKIHNMGIPISIFYRDAYWKYPSYSEGLTNFSRANIKKIIIKFMQIFQFYWFRKYINIIYFPSKLMANEFKCKIKATLPPGCFIAKTTHKKISKPIIFIFVGGAAKNHGTFLTIEAFEKLNKNEIKAKLIYICPKDQWEKIGIDEKKYSDWLKIVHASGDGLKEYYDKADISILTTPRSIYRDFAVPIKIFEYISYLKPILTTNCKETAAIVENNKIGWVVKDSSEDILKKIEYLYLHPEEIIEKQRKMLSVREKNLWERRALKVINDFEKLKL